MQDFRAHLDERLKPHAITSAQVRMLYEVRERPGVSGAAVARACAVTPQSAQAMLERAVGHGWIVRGRHPENDRLLTVELTPAGQKLLILAESIAREIEAEMWHGVSGAEIKTLTTVLERIASNLLP